MIERAEGKRWGPFGGQAVAKVRLVTNPGNDAEFRHSAEVLAERVETPEDLERELRADYDRARVVRGVTDVFERWYVYRDGSWVSSEEN